MQDQGVQLASNQVQYSLLYREPEKNGVLKACQELGVTLIAYSPLCQGLLTGNFVSLFADECTATQVAAESKFALTTQRQAGHAYFKSSFAPRGVCIMCDMLSCSWSIQARSHAALCLVTILQASQAVMH